MPITNCAIRAPIQYLMKTATTNVTHNGIIKKGTMDFNILGNLHERIYLTKYPTKNPTIIAPMKPAPGSIGITIPPVLPVSMFTPNRLLSLIIQPQTKAGTSAGLSPME
jgi:hypothetical protein